MHDEKLLPPLKKPSRDGFWLAALGVAIITAAGLMFFFVTQ